MVLTVLHAGGKFSKDSYKVSGGLHGVGVSCVNALSDYLKAEIHREGKIFVQEYSQGKPKYDVKVVGEAEDTGTTITFHPDPEIFTVSVYDYDILSTRLRELAYLNKGVRLSLRDDREGSEVVDENGESHKRSNVFYSENGLVEFVDYLDANRPEAYLPRDQQGDPHRDRDAVQHRLQREHLLIRQQYQHYRGRYSPFWFPPRYDHYS